MLDFLERTVPRISVDIDDTSERRLLMSWLMAKKFFSDSKVEVRYSPSHTGFHLIVHKEVSLLDNLLWRSMLNDDPNRIRFSLKRLFMDPDEKYIDLLFDYHKGGKAEVLNLERFLRPFQPKIRKILKNWDKGGIDKMVNEIANKIEGTLPTKKVFITSIAFNTIELRDKIRKICEDIHEGTESRPGDTSFRWKIYQNYLEGAKLGDSTQPQPEFMLSIFSPTKDQAFQRGEWFLRVRKGKPVVLSEEDMKHIATFKNDKGATVYYWIKEKK